MKMIVANKNEKNEIFCEKAEGRTLNLDCRGKTCYAHPLDKVYPPPICPEMCPWNVDVDISKIAKEVGEILNAG